jgi:hypothetical protein
MGVSDEQQPLSIRARRKAKAQIEKMERDRHVAFFQKRMDLARAGAMFFKEAKYPEAVKNYYLYLDILERSKKVKAGGLDLRHFDQKRDIAELLLLAGVYWDLSKLYDKASRKDVTKLTTTLDRFVLFSKGMPYQHVSAELLRKFLVNGNPKNRKQFKDAHIRLGGGRCFIATAVEEHCEIDTVPQLRNFRDQVLLKSPHGRTFVSVYYCVGPTLARLVLRTPDRFQKNLARFFDRLVKKMPSLK